MPDDEWRPELLDGGRSTEVDPRVQAVLEVLGGRSTAEVAQQWSVEGKIAFAA